MFIDDTQIFIFDLKHTLRYIQITKSPKDTISNALTRYYVSSNNELSVSVWYHEIDYADIKTKYQIFQYIKN